MRSSAVLVLGLVLAGCVAPAGVTPESVDVPPATRVLPDELVEPVLNKLALLGHSPGEPNIAMAPDGTLYVAGVNDIYRSDDGGATWELVAENLPGGGDGDITVTADGKVHWLGLFAPDAPIPYLTSTDRGDTWSDPVDLSDETGSDREWIDSRTDMPAVYAAWRDSDDGGIVAFRSSMDGGLTWNERVEISDDAVGGPLVHGPKPGQVYQAQATFETSPLARDASIRLARSADHGATWEVVDVLTPTQSVQFGLIGFPFSIFPVVAADDAGALYLVYAVDQGMVPNAPKPVSRFGVYLQVSKDEGTTWTQPRLLSDPAHAAIMPFVVAGAQGRIAVSWYENTYGVPNDFLPDLWHVKLLEGIMEHTDAPIEKVVQLTDEPNHIGSVCTSGVGCLLTGGDRSLLDFMEVALNAEGQPVVTWTSTDHPHQQLASFVTRNAGIPGVRVMARGVLEGTPLR